MSNDWQIKITDNAIGKRVLIFRQTDGGKIETHDPMLVGSRVHAPNTNLYSCELTFFPKQFQALFDEMCRAGMKPTEDK